jgi:hypothetical protein
MKHQQIEIKNENFNSSNWLFTLWLIVIAAILLWSNKLIDSTTHLSSNLEKQLFSSLLNAPLHFSRYDNVFNFGLFKWQENAIKFFKVLWNTFIIRCETSCYCFCIRSLLTLKNFDFDILFSTLIFILNLTWNVGYVQ